MKTQIFSMADELGEYISGRRKESPDDARIPHMQSARESLVRAANELMTAHAIYDRTHSRGGVVPNVRHELPREIPDHEFPHIVEVDREHLRCVCGATCDLSAWLTWLPLHGKGCAPASPNIQSEPRPGDGLTQSQPAKGNQ